MRAFACSYTGVGLFYKMQTSHGHLTSGYGSTNHTFPLVFGETGSFYTSVRTYPIATYCLTSETQSCWSVSARCEFAGKLMLYRSIP